MLPGACWSGKRSFGEGDPSLGRPGVRVDCGRVIQPFQEDGPHHSLQQRGSRRQDGSALFSRSDTSAAPSPPHKSCRGTHQSCQCRITECHQERYMGSTMEVHPGVALSLKRRIQSAQRLTKIVPRNTMKPTPVISLSGITENDVMASRARAIILRSGYFDSPANRCARS